MRSVVLTFFVLICWLFAACGHRSSDIREIMFDVSWTEDNSQKKGFTITYRRDGTAEVSVSQSGPGARVEANFTQRATITPEQFKALADTVVSNGFFDTTGPDTVVQGASERIIVVTAKGTQMVSVLSHRDPGLLATAQAIKDLRPQLKWENVPTE